MFHVAVGGDTSRCGRPAFSMVFDDVLSSEQRFSIIIYDGFRSVSVHFLSHLSFTFFPLRSLKFWKQSCKAWRGVRVIQTGCLFKCTIDIHRLHRPRNSPLHCGHGIRIPSPNWQQLKGKSCCSAARGKREWWKIKEGQPFCHILPNVGLILTTFWTLTCFAVVMTPPALSDNIFLGSAIRWDIYFLISWALALA